MYYNIVYPRPPLFLVPGGLFYTSTASTLRGSGMWPFPVPYLDSLSNSGL
jgi:hypothetical protein